MERFEILLAGHFESALTASEQEELVTRVRNDPAARRHFVAQAELDGLLWGHFAPQRVREEFLRRTVSCLPDVQRQEQTVEHVMARIAGFPSAVPAAAGGLRPETAPAGGDSRGKRAWRVIGDWRLWVAAAAALCFLTAALYQTFVRDLMAQHKRDLTALMRVATLEKQSGQVAVLSDYLDLKTPARTGQPLGGKNGLEIIGSGRAAVSYGDQTTLELVSTYQRACLWLCRPAEFGGRNKAPYPPNSKRVTLEAGVLEATVPRQADDAPMVLATPEADLQVLGTHFRLVTSPGCTRLDVYEGRVKVTRRADQQSLVVGANEFAIVKRGVELKALPGAAQPPAS